MFKYQKLPLGIDLSDASLKLFQFYKKRDGLFEVQAYSDERIPPEVSSGDAIKDPQRLAVLLKQTVAKPKFGRVTTDLAVASLPETKCFVRVIQVPQMSEAEAVEAIPWEAEAYIPLPRSQVYLDWAVLSEPHDGSGKMTVLITAAPQDYVDSVVEIIKQAGFKPVALEVESQATARSLVAKKDETVLIVDIDTVRTGFIIYEKGTLQFTSSLPIAGNAFTESIANALTLPFAEAEKLKRQVGIGEGPKQAVLKKALLPVLNNLAEEIKNTVRFYEEHGSANGKVSRLLLAGGSSKLKHLPSFLHEELKHSPAVDHELRSLPGIKVELGNPWVNVLRKGQIQPLSREDSLSYATAIGLALRVD